LKNDSSGWLSPIPTIFIVGAQLLGCRQTGCLRDPRMEVCCEIKIQARDPVDPGAGFAFLFGQYDPECRGRRSNNPLGYYQSNFS
jgi:hypothetical protein